MNSRSVFFATFPTKGNDFLVPMRALTPLLDQSILHGTLSPARITHLPAALEADLTWRPAHSPLITDQTLLSGLAAARFSAESDLPASCRETT